MTFENEYNIYGGKWWKDYYEKYIKGHGNNAQ